MSMITFIVKTFMDSHLNTGWYFFSYENRFKLLIFTRFEAY
jgi:hypothetical protein